MTAVSKYASMSMLVSLFLLLGVSQCESEELRSSHPFHGVPLEQTHLTSESGRKYVRLHREKSRMPSLRKIEQDFADLDELEPEEYFPDYSTRLKQAVFGKDEEDLEFEELKKVLVNRARSSRLNLQQTYDAINWGDYNTIYMMSVFVGSEAYQMDLVMDTGSAWMIAMSVNCDYCAGDFGMFDEDTSSTFERDYPYFLMSYGSAQAYGYYVNDQVWLDEGMSVGVLEFPFYLIDMEAGLSPLSGILGFSRDYSFSSGYPPGPLYYHFLYDNSEITDLLFATYFSDADLDDSFVEMGGYDETGDNYEGDLVWIDVIDNYFWAATTKGMIANGNFIETDSSTTTYIILDTGTSLNYISEDIGKTIQKQIGKKFRGIKFLGNWYMKCNLEKYESVYVEMGGYFFEIPPETYIFDFTDSSSGAYSMFCFLGFTLTSSAEWLFGEVFFRNYYTVWDEANSQVGLAVKKNSHATEEPYAS